MIRAKDKSKAAPPAIVRIIFPAPAILKERLERSWHSRRDGSLSAAIRRLLERALLAEECGK